MEKADLLRHEDPRQVEKAARESIAAHVRAMLEMQKEGSATLDYGNNIRQIAREEGVVNRL